MAKKELPDIKDTPNLEPELELKPSGLSGKISGFTLRAFGIVKFTLGVCLLPFVYSSTTALLNELGVIELVYRHYFWSGVISLLVVYLFVWEPAVIYTKGQELLGAVFNFFKPLVRVAPYLLPIYTIILFIAFGLLTLIAKSEWLLRYCVFLLGFTVSLHLVFSAKSVRTKKNDFLKGNYIFGFSFIYILNIALLAFLLNLLFKAFSFVNFTNNSFQSGKDIFYAIFKQLFLRQ